MTLDVLIATHTPDGIRRVERMELPRVEGVRYLVSWQMHGDAPVPRSLQGRDDVEVGRVDSIGLSRNRNHGIGCSTGDIYLIADDDLVYTPERLASVIEAFRARPEMEVAAFRYDGSDSKAYPSGECPLMPYPKDYYPSSIEIAVRRTERTSRLRFDERFGLGSGVFHSGEEDVFLLCARELGLDMRFIPLTVACHEGLTTGMRRIEDVRVLRGTGAVISYLYPVSFILRIPLKAWRMARTGQSPFARSVVEMVRGVVGAVKIGKPWKRV